MEGRREIAAAAAVTAAVTDAEKGVASAVAVAPVTNCRGCGCVADEQLKRGASLGGPSLLLFYSCSGMRAECAVATCPNHNLE